LAVFSVTLDLMNPPPGSLICQRGLCRLGQVFTDLSARDGAPVSLPSLVNEDPADPYVWCNYADALVTNGHLDQASAAFDHAMTLGPNLPPVLIRAGYFDFTHGQLGRGLVISNRILVQTDDLDAVLFSYLQYFGQGTATLLGTAIPTSVRPARAWAAWIARNGSEGDARETWAWTLHNHLTDENTALDFSRTLWERQFYRTAQELWLEWLGPAGSDYPARELIFNREFAQAPNSSPFDWTIPAQRSIEISRGQGLKVRFEGGENVELNIQQSVVVNPGRYRFSAEIESEDLTTDQRPFFHIFDPGNLARLDIKTPQISGHTARSKTDLEFTVAPDTQVLIIQLERRASERFDNKIQGTLHVHGVSLVPIDQHPK
jgi:hypothetical protein